MLCNHLTQHGVKCTAPPFYGSIAFWVRCREPNLGANLLNNLTRKPGREVVTWLATNELRRQVAAGGPPVSDIMGTTSAHRVHKLMMYSA